MTRDERMRCPVCGELMRVVDSWRSADGLMLSRRYRCLTCDHRLTSKTISDVVMVPCPRTPHVAGE